jgi:hypothetical protein
MIFAQTHFDDYSPTQLTNERYGLPRYEKETDEREFEKNQKRPLEGGSPPPHRRAQEATSRRRPHPRKIAADA